MHAFEFGVTGNSSCMWSFALDLDEEIPQGKERILTWHQKEVGKIRNHGNPFTCCAPNGSKTAYMRPKWHLSNGYRRRCVMLFRLLRMDETCSHHVEHERAQICCFPSVWWFLESHSDQAHRRCSHASAECPDRQSFDPGQVQNSANAAIPTSGLLPTQPCTTCVSEQAINSAALL